MSSVAETERLFLAAWPDSAVQRALGEVAAATRQECGGRAVPPRNIHLTLAFLGDVARLRRAEIETLAGGVRAPRFVLSVDRIEYWRHNRIVWAGVEDCPEALRLLVARLEDALSPAGFRFERQPYVPHVTLLRDARRGPARGRIAPVTWPVTGFALVRSVPLERGRLYELVRAWPLGQ